MSVGAFFDKIIMIAAGIYAIYLSKTKQEKLGNKAKLLKYCGIGLVAIAIILSPMSILK